MPIRTQSASKNRRALFASRAVRILSDSRNRAGRSTKATHDRAAALCIGIPAAGNWPYSDRHPPLLALRPMWLHRQKSLTSVRATTGKFSGFGLASVFVNSTNCDPVSDPRFQSTETIDPPSNIGICFCQLEWTKSLSDIIRSFAQGECNSRLDEACRNSKNVVKVLNVSFRSVLYSG